jgi:hypothetical protein
MARLPNIDQQTSSYRLDMSEQRKAVLLRSNKTKPCYTKFQTLFLVQWDSAEFRTE